MSRIFRLLIVLTSLCSVLSGCGGGGGGRGKSANTPVTTATFSIAWSARSRAIAAPSSALSAAVILVGASSTGSNLVTTVNRSSAPEDYVGEYSTREPVKIGNHIVTVRFFAGPDGAGEVVAEGTANVTISPAGTGMGAVAVNKAVTSVAVVPGQVVPMGTEAQLQFTARDANGMLLALSPGSDIWSKGNGTGELDLTADGIATPTLPGEVNVAVKVDGVLSPTVPVVVSAAPVTSVTVTPYQSVPLGWSKSLWFEVKDALGNTLFPAPRGAVWSIVDGASVLQVNSDGTVTATGAGVAHVRVAVAGLTSAPMAVTVPDPGTGGTIPGSPPYFVYLTGVTDGTYPFDLSGDGSVAVGYSQYGGAFSPVFWRDPSTFASSLPGLEQPSQALLAAVSEDGTVGLGTSFATNQQGIPVLFRLDGGQTALPLPSGKVTGAPVDLSADGTVALCTDHPQTSPYNPRPYVVREGTATFLPLPAGANRVGVAAISGDGSTVVGGIDGRAVRWVNEGPPEFIGGDGTGASGVSFDGRVVVGTQLVDISVRTQPFRWTPAGGIQPLPTSTGYPKNAAALGVSDDGRTVLITGDGDDGFQGVAQLWREGQETRTLADIYADAGGDSASFDGANPRALSGDGRTVLGHGKRVGPGSARSGEWKLRLP